MTNNTPPSGPPPGPVGPPPEPTTDVPQQSTSEAATSSVPSQPSLPPKRRSLRYRLRMLLRTLSVLATLVGLATGGYGIYSLATQNEPTPNASSDSPATASTNKQQDAKDTTTDALTTSTDSERCTSDRLGVTINIPEGWYANEEPSDHACEYFQDSPFTASSNPPDPESVAIRLDRIDGSFDNASKNFHGTPPSGTAFEDVTDLTVNGHRAIRLLVGETPGTLRLYTYAIELEDDLIIMLALHPIYGDGNETTVDEIAQSIVRADN